jgi:hypothetical protein
MSWDHSILRSFLRRWQEWKIETKEKKKKSAAGMWLMQGDVRVMMICK